MVETDSPQLTG